MDPNQLSMKDVIGMRRLSSFEERSLEFLRAYRHAEDFGAQPIPPSRLRPSSWPSTDLLPPNSNSYHT